MTESYYIDDEFKKRLPPLTTVEREVLKANILRDKRLNNPVVVWKEQQIIVDGHHRYELCNELADEGHDIQWPKPIEKSFASREEALAWMDNNARGQRNLTEQWKNILAGRAYNAAKREPGSTKRFLSTDGQQQSGDDVAESTGIKPTTLKRYAKKAEVFDDIAHEFGEDSEEAREAMTAPQKAVEAILDKQQSPEQALKTIKREKNKKKKKPKKSGDTEFKAMYDENPTSFRERLDKVKDAGKLPKEEFWNRVGNGKPTASRWFKTIVAEIHYIHIFEDEDTCELFIDEEEQDLCTAIHKQLERMKKFCRHNTKFKFDMDMYKKTLQDLYDLINKASTHK